MAIDRMVQEKVDAYRNNPAALQKNYQMNQDLLDLLALQKIKSEKDAAQRELAMSMEQNPQTIAQQRGEEAVRRTKDDLIKQVGGVAQQNEREKQGNIQRAAAGAPPAGAQMAGIAGQPAPNMARMAGGGIVSFAGKGDSLVKVTDAQLERMRLTREQWESGALSDEVKEIYRNRFPALSEDASQFRRDIIGVGDLINRPVAREAAARTAQGLFGGVKQIGAYFDSGSEGRATGEELNKALTEADRIRGLGQPLAANQMPVNTASMVAQDIRQPNAMGGRPPAGRDNLPPPGPDPFAPKVAPTIERAAQVSEMSLPAASEAAFKRMSEMDRVRFDQAAQSTFLKEMQEQDPALVRQKERDSAAQFLDRSGIASKYGDMQRRQRTLSERGAASRKDSRLYDLLARTGGQGFLADAGRAASDMRRGDRMQDQLDLTNEQAIERAGLSADIGVAESSLLSGDKAADLTSAEKKAAAAARSDLLNNQATNLTEEALAVLRADIANISEAAAYRRDIITLRTTNMSAQVKENIANFNGKITTDTNNIRLLVAKVSSASDINTALGRINSSMAEIKTDVAEQLKDRLATDIIYIDLQAEDAKNAKDGKPTNNAAKYRATIQKLLDEIAQNAVSELQEQREVLTGKYNYLTADIGNTGLGQTRITPSS